MQSKDIIYYIDVPDLYLRKINTILFIEYIHAPKHAKPCKS